MTDSISEVELLEFLNCIENGEVFLKQQDDPQDIYAGNVRYVASNGWRIVVFNDANEWDYIDEVRSDDGRILGYDEIEEMATAGAYEPSEDVSWSRYGIPGHMKFRCKECGMRLRDGPPYLPPYVCHDCKG
jgi:hypothetical protein